jgi:hypothetical protein
VGIDSGEGDFAILKAANPADILKFVAPASIRNGIAPNPLLIFAHDENNNSFSPNLSIGQPVKVIGYPIPLTNPNLLPRKEDHLIIKEIFGFAGGNEGDLIETSASTVGKNGASGGAVIDSENYLIGIIANIIPTQDPGEADIRAISLDHIQHVLHNQTGISLYDLIHSDGSALKKTFESKYLRFVKSDLLGS